MAGDGIEQLEQELEKTRRDFERLKDKYQRRGTGKSKQQNHVLILMVTWIEGQLLGLILNLRLYNYSSEPWGTGG